jgi:hypothetical protein
VDDGQKDQRRHAGLDERQEHISQQFQLQGKLGEQKASHNAKHQ